MPGPKGIGDYAAEAYRWVNTPLIDWPVHLPDIHKMESGAIDSVIDSSVRWILEQTGLMAELDKVTGLPEALHAAGQTWLNQASAVNSVLTDLTTSARTLPEEWQGQASAAFGSYMGKIAASLEAMGGDMVTTAQILNEAGQECQLAQDLVIMIIREAAEWAAATLAATALADIVTLGLATVAGGIAESAEMAAFLARATEVSAKLGKALNELVSKIKELKGAAEDVRTAEGIRNKLSEFQGARDKIDRLRLAGRLRNLPGALKDGNLSYVWQYGFRHGYGTVKTAAGAAVALTTGLPSGVGITGLGGDIMHGAQTELTNDQNLPADAQIIDELTHTGPGVPPPPYHAEPGPPPSESG